MRVAIYANSGEGYGDGHAERCLLLLTGFRTRICRVGLLFSFKTDQGKVDKDRMDYNHTGCVFSAIFSGFTPDLLLVDSYQVTFSQRPAYSAKSIVVGFDDLADRELDVDILIDGNPLRKVSDYKTVTPESATVLAGAEYLMFSPGI